MDIILGVAGFTLAFCFLSIFMFQSGVKHAVAVYNKQPLPDVLPNPIKAVTRQIEGNKAKAQEDKLIQGINNIFSFDGTPQAEVK